MAFSGLFDTILDEGVGGPKRKHTMPCRMHYGRPPKAITTADKEVIKKLSTASYGGPPQSFQMNEGHKTSYPQHHKMSMISMTYSQPFCSPVVPHVPIRERLARRGTSADVNEDAMAASYCSSFYGQPRRRRMSLLQTLRQQNKQLADSGFELHRQRTDSESTNRDTCSPPLKTTPPVSPTKKAFSNLKAKLFGKKEKVEKRLESQSSNSVAGDYSQSCELTNGRSRKSPSTTNDSGHGSQGHLEERGVKETVVIVEREDEKESERQRPRRRIRTCKGVRETVVIVEREDEKESERQRPRRRMRTFSCPSLPGLCNLSHPNHFEGEEDEDIQFNERMIRNSSPITASDVLLERRLLRKALEVERRRLHEATLRQQPRATMAIPESCNESIDGAVEDTVDDVAKKEDNSIDNRFFEDEKSHRSLHSLDRRSLDSHLTHPHFDRLSMTSAQTEDLCDYDDNVSVMILDHYLPLSRSEAFDHDDEDTHSSSLSLNNLNRSDQEFASAEVSSGGTGVSAQTDLSLLHISENLASYLNRLNLDEPPSPEGMNFIAKHFFEYQSFINLPHKAVQLHKAPPSQAGTDPSGGWAPKNMNRAGKNQPAPASRSNRTHRDPRPNGTKHGRAGRHEHREWGDRHGDLKEEKVAPHKDAWTKFLSNEDPHGRTMFECDFEDQVLQHGDESLPERMARTANEREDYDFQMAYNATKSSSESGCELLTILTYAPLVQFVTATVKKAKTLPYNNSPFARIMLFDGRRLVEQKQTTVNPSDGVASSVDSASKPSSSSVSSSLSSSSGDASFSESFLFHVPPSKLDRAHIVIEMFDHNSSGQTISVGHCVIGRMSEGTGSAHWYQMVKKHGLPVCMWHRITSNRSIQ